MQRQHSATGFVRTLPPIQLSNYCSNYSSVPSDATERESVLPEKGYQVPIEVFVAHMRAETAAPKISDDAQVPPNTYTTDV